MRPGRRPGLADMKAQKERRDKMRAQGARISAESAREMKQQLTAFRGNLEQFARQHKKEIQQDPAFRAKFHSMCASIGVDPLTSKKGVWADLFGMGDFYYELAVRIIEICVATRPINGGLMSLKELVAVLRSRRMTYTEQISSDDAEKAVAKLGVLGSGFRIMDIGNDRIVRSVPVELSVDHTRALESCGDKGYTSAAELQRLTGWNISRVNDTLQYLLENEFAWLDTQSVEATYWILGLLAGSSSQT